MNEHGDESGRRCAWCDAPLPDPAGGLAVVHGADGTLLLTCGLPCLAMLVATLAGRSARDRRYTEGVRN